MVTSGIEIRGNGRLAWDGCCNVRDLGGLMTETGRPIRPGALVRADTVGKLTPAGLAALEAHGVRTIIDLRDPEDTEPTYPAVPTLTRHRRPLMDADDFRFVDALPATDTLGVLYCRLADRYGAVFAEIIQLIVASPPGGVIIHCRIGKDRTGVAVAIVLDLLGVDRTEIVRDYEASAEGLRDQIEEELRALIHDPTVHEREQRNSLSYAGNMERFLAHIDLHYGGTAAFLGHHGVTAADQAALIARLTAPDHR